MKERSSGHSAIRKTEENQRKKEKAVAAYMRDEIGREEYIELMGEVAGIDLRAIASWQMRLERQRKIENAKNKVKGVVSAIRERLT